MLILPKSGEFVDNDVRYFNNYSDFNTSSFSSFPYGSVNSVLRALRSLINNEGISPTYKLRVGNISDVETLFAKNTLKIRNREEETNLNSCVENNEMEGVNIGFVKNIYYRFYLLNLDEEFVDHSLYTLSYTTISGFKIVDFFFDININMLELFTKVIDSMIIESLSFGAREIGHNIPINILNNNDPGYIIFPNYVSIYAFTDFINRYLDIAFTIYDNSYPFDDSTLTQLIIQNKEDNVFDIFKFLYGEKYSEAINNIFISDEHSIDKIQKLYSVYLQ